MSDIIMLAGGLALLLVGGELLVRGSVAVAERAGMSPLLIGLTLVGFGTSAPELVTSVQASLAGSPGIAIGNIVGSNISNIFLILGLAAVVSPIVVASAALARDGMIVVATAIAFTAVGHFWQLDRAVGAAALVLLVTYLVYAWRQESRPREVAVEGHTSAYERGEAFEELHDGPLKSQPAAKRLAQRLGALMPVLMALAGLALVVGGGKLLVDGAVGMARAFGISETVIGLTIVAVGTSAPELVTSLVAAVRGHSAVALGNVLGSNIYNTLGIGGATALMAPTGMPAEVVRFDNYVMVAASVLLIVLARSGFRINRMEGALLVACYAGYLWALWPK
ncbi:MAG: calcium/sodium antiporter [Hyphomicrobiaceae bacterium]